MIVNFAISYRFRYTAGLGYFDNGRLAEIFLNAEKIGTVIETAGRDGRAFALARECASGQTCNDSC